MMMYIDATILYRLPHVRPFDELENEKAQIGTWLNGTVNIKRNWNLELHNLKRI